MTQFGMKGAGGRWRPSVSVMSLGMATMAFIIATFATMAIERHRSLLDEARLQNEKLADSLEEHARGAMRLAALTLGTVAERLDREGEGLAPNDPGFDRFLGTLLARAPVVAGILVLDQGGRTLHSHPEQATVTMEGGEGGRAGSGAPGVRIGAPSVSRSNGGMVLPISLPRLDARGAFAGTVVALVRLDEFTGLYEAVRSRPNGTVALFRRGDALLLARAPVDAAMLGQTFADGPLFREHLPKASRGSYLQVVATDRTLRHASFRSVAEQGVVIGVSSADADVMVVWWRHMLALAMIGLPLLLASAWVTWRLYRELQHRERVERLLAFRSADLELANEELRQVARMSAHHLQEPLRTLLSYSQLLVRRQGGSADGEAAEYVTFIGHGVTRMKGLLTALQRYLALEREDAEPIALAEVFDEVVDRLGSSLAAAGITVRRSGDLPVVLGNRDQFAVLFNNLIESAAAHHDDTHPMSISVSAELRQAEWLLTVVDSGADRWAGRRSFDLIAPGGWGASEPSLGLALCRKIVHLHGGRMHMEPGTEGGARVLIVLPAG